MVSCACFKNYELRAPLEIQIFVQVKADLNKKIISRGALNILFTLCEKEGTVTIILSSHLSYYRQPFHKPFNTQPRPIR